MKTLLLLLFSCVVSKANNSFYDVICDESMDRGLYFEPVACVRGRFFLKWCDSALANKNGTKWNLRLDYDASLKPEQCNKYLYDSFNKHSNFEVPVQVNLNCTNVCYTATLDAIFSSTCYKIITKQLTVTPDRVYHIPVTSPLAEYTHYQYVRENVTSTTLTIQDVTTMGANANYQSNGEEVILDWFPGIPASQYEVFISPNGTDTTTENKVYMNCSIVWHKEKHCNSLSPQKVNCRARANESCYSAQFKHEAPWISLHTHPSINFHYTFCHNLSASLKGPDRPLISPQLWWVLVGIGSAFLLGLLALLALLLCRAASAGQLRRNILRSWIDDITRRLERPRETRAAERILLLYARDCAHLERAARHLAALLQQLTGCEVIDLYSPETVAASAPAAGPWLRALLLRTGTRVLLIQSPATDMYCARLKEDQQGSPTLEAPLLGSRVAWRRPHAADAQLLLALRLLADSAHHEPLPYKKYYVATVAGLQHGDVVPALTPQRRYPLPHAATILLRDLAPPSHPTSDLPLNPAAQHLLELFTEALEDFHKFARDNPDYLFQDLVLE
ncbi:uncharacterized protein LOC123869878 [Maniola jurtina]|uniref:uncharacterized protein LOC123869878 n=1 Tax=Maniola jurtina TaxID=191418 RepID=UPI001E68D837|nr:uncharacterized protein LOC123869878 [Maniola jurtina]